MRDNINQIGQPISRIDAESKALGTALFPGDFNRPAQLYMKVLFANRPHAIVRAINTEKAEALQGVVAVLTARDVPHNIYGMIIPDQPVLCGPGSDQPFADRIRFVGDQVAVILAETERIAEKARDLIEIAYENLPTVGSIDAALDASTPLIHPDKGSNVFHSVKIRQGDVDKAFSECAVVVEDEYHTPVQEHAYLQPEAGLGYLDEQGRITVVVAGQCNHEDRHQIAHALGLPEEKIRVIYPYIGGAFGGREDVSIQIVLALAVYHLDQRGIRRPVKIVWSREESIMGHGKRHAYRIRAKLGADRTGKLLAAELDILGDGGAYAYSSTPVLGNTALMGVGPYEIPHVSVHARMVHTNNIPAGAFRGFGGPQGSFVAETQLNRLADALGLDHVAIRMQNLVEEGSLLSVGTPLPAGVTIKPVVEALAEKTGWKQLSTSFQRSGKSEVQRGVGFACGFKNVGFSFGTPEYCNARIELIGKSEVEKAVLYHAGAEVGQGAHTVFKQMTAEALGIPLDRVEMHLSDTGTSEYAGSVSASRMTFMAGNAIQGAAQAALRHWRDEDRPAVGEFTYYPPKTTSFDPQTGFCAPNFAYGYVAEIVELEVDTETGEICLLKVHCANDVGKAINPLAVQGQIEGAIVQAAGYVLQEDFQQKDGYILTDRLSKYMIPTVNDIPLEINAIILEYPDPLGPFGARGMGEMPFMPFAPAVIDALHDATGVWFTEFPLTPERVLKGLGKL